MTKIINLRLARKTAARDAARKQGDENAARFGRTKQQKQVEKDDRDRAARHLDGHRRDGDSHDA
ncbi:DUF4169 family protein [Paracoccus shanxieyensis]|uniref:DUF4169 family protein n=1 Tax=Paracoccus shanxieyensis TaxID=2675752 RepID=A0A6L6IZ42_9RHOB|nr:DUF4169 family protein [Paracoccus shanxieyensis]MTH64512.1 DUF4169 family protein [Paracoccus shanxieyensis]MTH87495.1 DUF4169 family protein [Paracoccus shanxieyensis]